MSSKPKWPLGTRPSHRSNCTVRSILNDLKRIGPELWERFNADEDGIRWYYREMAQEMRKAWPDNPLIEEFSDTVGQINNRKPKESK